MKKFVLATFATLGLCAVSIGASAATTGCGVPRNAFDQVYCAGNLFGQIDKDLNTTYGSLRKHLNADQSTALKNGQLAWIKSRDEACSYEKPGAGYFVNLACAIDKTNERLAFLKDRERECSSTGCVTSKIGE
jgi:uncharacterized protein YecT (DUF1311 family)